MTSSRAEGGPGPSPRSSAGEESTSGSSTGPSTRGPRTSRGFARGAWPRSGRSRSGSSRSGSRRSSASWLASRSAGCTSACSGSSRSRASRWTRGSERSSLADRVRLAPEPVGAGVRAARRARRPGRRRDGGPEEEIAKDEDGVRAVERGIVRGIGSILAGRLLTREVKVIEDVDAIRDVEATVAVRVASVEGGGRREPEYQEQVPVIVLDEEIRETVDVQVARGQEAGSLGGRELHGRLEHRASFVPVHGDLVRIRVREHEVQPPIPVEVVPGDEQADGNRAKRLTGAKTTIANVLVDDAVARNDVRVAVL